MDQGTSARARCPDSRLKPGTVTHLACIATWVVALLVRKAGRIEQKRTNGLAQPAPAPASVAEAS
ncbi:hypothetical protein GCM10010313_01990 [Streptomyces violarus]|nr:hypothetical protein GCM10010313_01990 [Streptomyces violarus]